MIHVGDIIAGEVVDIAFGGNGIIKQSGFVIFVPYTAIGDFIRCKITKLKRSHAYGTILAIEKPSLQRIIPQCPYFGICGGCQLQHIDYSAQIQHKLKSVRDALERIGNLSIDFPIAIAPAVQQWAYRRYIQLTLKEENQKILCGYIANDNHSLIEVFSCPIFHDPSDLILEQIQILCKQFHPQKNTQGRLSIYKLSANQYLLGFKFNTLPQNFETIIKDNLPQFPHWSGVMVTSENETKTYGNVNLELTIDPLRFAFSPKAFIQNHPEQSLKIYQTLCGIAQKINSKKILDLYCGIGISSLLLARQGIDIQGIEVNEEAVALAQQNAKFNALSNACFEQGDVQKILAKNLKLFDPDTVIINPPRTGLTPSVISALKTFRPRHILYISCMPSTLARDLSSLCPQTYHLKECQAFDMFPQTGHVETVVTLEKSD